MNSNTIQFHKLQANLERLQTRMPDAPVLSMLLSRLILQLGRGMSGMLEQAIRPYGLAEPEFRVLMTLFSQPEGAAHPSELCARTSQSPANMSRIGDALVARDLITRVSSLHDRRKMVLHITEQGEDLVRQLLPTLFGPLRDLFEGISEVEQHQLAAQLKRLASQLDAILVDRVPERP